MKSKASSRGALPQKGAMAAYASGQVSVAPSINMGNNGRSCRVRHRELVSSITGTVAFTVSDTLALNPGLAASFPWLSTMAQSWERYRFNRLAFRFYTRTGTNVPGSVMLVPDYDAADSAPATEQVASAFQDVAEDAPWKDISCNLPSRNLNGSFPEHYVRTAALATNQDVKTYDVGQLFVCTVDGTAVAWGKLWVEYDIEFFIPQLPPAGPVPLGCSWAGNSGMTGAKPFGTAPIADAASRGIVLDGNSIVTFSAIGNFLLAGDITGTVISAMPTPTLGAGVSSLAYRSSFPTAATTGTWYIAVRVTSLVGATLTFSTWTATTITASSLQGAQAPDGTFI